MNKWQGESERKVSAVFKRARSFGDRGCIIFFDEIDVFCSERGAEGESDSLRRIKTQLLVEMDGMQGRSSSHGVLVMGATNLIHALDPAMMRRFGKQVYVGLPGEDARARLIRKFTDLEDENEIRELARASGGFSGSQLHTVAMQAGEAKLNEFLGTKWLVPCASGGGPEKWRPAELSDFEDRFCVACDAEEDEEQGAHNSSSPTTTTTTSSSSSTSRTPCRDCGWLRAGVLDVEPNTVRVSRPEFRHFAAALHAEKCRIRDMNNGPSTRSAQQPIVTGANAS